MVTSLGLSDCPQDDWAALDAAQIAANNGALVAVLNGPRFWTLDAIISDIRNDAPTQVFGNIEMFSAATTQLGSLGSVLQLPAGWTFSTQVLAADLSILSDDAGNATIVQDEFQNTYQLVTGP